MCIRDSYRTFGEPEAAEVYCVRAADYIIDWFWEPKRREFVVGGFSHMGRTPVHEGGLPICQALAPAYAYTGDARYMEIAEKVYLNLMRNMAARKTYLSALDKMQGPTTALSTMSRFHYHLNQYRTHRDAQCPTEYSKLNAEGIKTLLGSEGIAEKRIRLCQALAAKAGPGDAAILEKVAAEDPDEQVARNAATSLGNVHTAEAAKLLKKLSRSAKRMPVRLASLHSLVRNRKAAGLTEQMTALLSDSEPLVRITAARLLFKLDKKLTVAVLTEMLEKEKSPYVRKEMLQLLGMTGDRSVIKTLVAAVKNRSAHAVERGGAALGLGELGADDPEIVQALIVREPGTVKNYGVRALVTIGTDKAVEALINRYILQMKTLNYYWTNTSLNALRHFPPGPKISAHLVRYAMRDMTMRPHPDRLRRALIASLADRTDTVATEGLRNIAANHKDETIRALAATLGL